MGITPSRKLDLSMLLYTGPTSLNPSADETEVPQQQVGCSHRAHHPLRGFDRLEVEMGRNLAWAMLWPWV